MKSLILSGVLLFSLCYSDALKFRCDYRYTYLGWIKYHEIPATWADARLQCKLEGAMLASPTSSSMKAYMMESFCKPEIFVGIHATFAKGQYTTVDGFPLSEIPHEWAPMEPDNKNNNESCLALNSDGKLSDVNCDEPRPYICFRENSNVDVSVCGTNDQEYRFESQVNKCYKLHINPRTFVRAYFTCYAEGGHLAIINSEDEAKVIRDVYARYPIAKMLPGKFHKDYAFVGFSNWGENFDWTSIHGQTLQEAGYAKFVSGQPDNAAPGEYCGAVHRNGLLNDLNCDLEAVFICEKRPDYPAVCDIEDSKNKTKYIPNCDNDDIRIDVRSPTPSDSNNNINKY